MVEVKRERGGKILRRRRMQRIAEEEYYGNMKTNTDGVQRSD